MTAEGERRIGAVFGLLGAVLIALDGLLDIARGVFYVVVGRGEHAYSPFGQAIVFLVVGLIIGLFSIMGAVPREGRATVAGAVLLVLAVVGWLVLGFGSGILAILGTVLVLVSAVVFLVSGH